MRATAEDVQVARCNAPLWTALMERLGYHLCEPKQDAFWKREGKLAVHVFQLFEKAATGKHVAHVHAMSDRGPFNVVVHQGGDTVAIKQFRKLGTLERFIVAATEHGRVLSR